MLILNLPALEVPTKKEPIRTLRFPSRLPCHIINLNYLLSLTFYLGDPSAYHKESGLIREEKI